MIWLLRHGDAEHSEGKPDAERDLTEKGERQSRAAGRALKELGVKLDVCLTVSEGARSPHGRTRLRGARHARSRRTTASPEATSTRSSWPPAAAR